MGNWATWKFLNELAFWCTKWQYLTFKYQRRRVENYLKIYFGSFWVSIIRYGHYEQ